VELPVIEVEVAAPKLGRLVIAGSLGLGSALHPAVSTEGPLLGLPGPCQAVPIDLVAVCFVVAAGSGLALGLPWLPSGGVLMWVGRWTGLWVEAVSSLGRNFDPAPAVWDRQVTLSSSASHMAATELGYGFVS